MVSIVREDFFGWPNPYRLSNGRIEARVVADVGPPIIDVRPSGGQSLGHFRPPDASRSGDNQWILRGVTIGATEEAARADLQNQGLRQTGAAGPDSLSRGARNHGRSNERGR